MATSGLTPCFSSALLNRALPLSLQSTCDPGWRAFRPVAEGEIGAKSAHLAFRPGGPADQAADRSMPFRRTITTGEADSRTRPRRSVEAGQRQSPTRLNGTHRGCRQRRAWRSGAAVMRRGCGAGK